MWFAFVLTLPYIIVCRQLCIKNFVMLNGLPVLTVCDVTLSVAGKGKLTTTTAGNAHTMPHQLDVGPTVIAQCPRCQPQQLLRMFFP